ncbi:unnamed protein product [Schistosoma turkestanicum]|nr:unnamed protein product [Schistosoma turkestanicum]
MNTNIRSLNVSKSLRRNNDNKDTYKRVTSNTYIQNPMPQTTDALSDTKANEQLNEPNNNNEHDCPFKYCNILLSAWRGMVSHCYSVQFLEEKLGQESERQKQHTNSYAMSSVSIYGKAG